MSQKQEIRTGNSNKCCFHISWLFDLKMVLPASWSSPKGFSFSYPGSGLGRSPGVWNSNSFQYSCLEHFIDRRAGGLKPMGSQIQTWVSTHACMPCIHSGNLLSGNSWLRIFPSCHTLPDLHWFFPKSLSIKTTSIQLLVSWFVFENCVW